MLSSTARSTVAPLATLIEVRNQAYDANYRNDQAGLEAAISSIRQLIASPEIKPHADYYLSWSYWALSAAQLQRGDAAGALESARLAVTHARAAVAVRPDDAECQAQLANALIVVALLDKARFQDTATELRAVRKRALALGPANPRVVLMDAGMIFNNPPQFGGGREEGIARMQEALTLFEREAATSAPPVAPRWGHALALGWLAQWYLQLTPPQPDKAKSSAEMSLRMRPDFWYVKEQVMPKLGH
jgi:hypothetical protein